MSNTIFSSSTQVCDYPALSHSINYLSILCGTVHWCIFPTAWKGKIQIILYDVEKGSVYFKVLTHASLVLEGFYASYFLCLKRKASHLHHLKDIGVDFCHICTAWQKHSTSLYLCGCFLYQRFSVIVTFRDSWAEKEIWSDRCRVLNTVCVLGWHGLGSKVKCKKGLCCQIMDFLPTGQTLPTNAGFIPIQARNVGFTPKKYHSDMLGIPKSCPA